jgi:hypothetical protein
MAQQCGFSGNSDLYGLGIRVGVYLQWLASQIAVYFHLEGSNDLSDAYFIFSIAIMIALFVLTFQDAAYTLEIVIMAYMFFGGLFCVQGYRKRREQAAPTVWRMLLGNAIIFGISIFSSWFWTTGRSSDRFIGTPCGTTVFLFARIPARHFGRVSVLFAVCSIYFSVGVPVLLVRRFYQPAITFIRRKIHRPTAVEELPSSMKPEIIHFLNRDARAHLILFLQYYCGVSPSAASSAQLDDIENTQLVISVSNGATKHAVPFKPPLTSHREIVPRIREMYDEAQQELRAESTGGESETLSVTGRFKASYRHLQRLFKPRPGNSHGRQR